MRNVCYHVAVSIDGFIARQDGSIAGFLEGGDHVDDYMAALAEYDTVIMGRKTYEFGYSYGLTPGERAYENMEHWIFSKSINVPQKDGVNIVRDDWLDRIDKLKSNAGPDIYLCGGSVFAGWLMSERRIDRLKLKVNPVAFGTGMPLFASSSLRAADFNLISTTPYKSGVILNEYARASS